MKNAEKFRKTESFIESLEPLAGSLFVDAIKKSLGICLKNSIFEGVEGLNPIRKINWADYTANPMVAGGLEILRKINAKGYEAYLVGGAVRDIIMGTKMSDFDINTNMPIPVLKENFQVEEIEQKGTGKGKKTEEELKELKKKLELGVVIVIENGEPYEVAQFRVESGTSDNRRPDEVKFVSSVVKDLERRDFTFGAMIVDADGNLYDPMGGIKDIEEKKIRMVGNPKDRIHEDALRILRAISFAGRLGFEIMPEVEEAIINHRELLSGMPVERFRKELKEKIIGKGKDKFSKALKLFEKYGLFKVIFPEINITGTKRAAIDRAQSDSTIVNFGILLYDMDPNDIVAFVEKNKFPKSPKSVGERKEQPALIYIARNIGNYPILEKLDRQKGYEIVTNEFFPELREVFVAINGSDIPGVDETVNKIISFAEIDKRKKGITQIILSKGIAPGPAIGEIHRNVRTWLFSEFEKGNIPSDEEIGNFIEENK